MKFFLRLVALVVFCSAGHSQAAESPSVSLTTVRGYVYTAGRWQPHVCRTFAPARTRRVVQTSPNGAPRQLGHVVRCHHGEVFVPGTTAERRIMSAPNRSSRFAPPAYRRRIVSVQIHTDEYELPDVLPREPYRGGPSSPVLEDPVTEPDYEMTLILIEQNRPLRSTPYRLPPPPYFPRVPE